jgi:hypothetical protein
LSEEEPKPPRDLEYRDRQLDSPERDPVMAQFVGGAVFGVLAVGVVGLCVFLATMQIARAPSAGTTVSHRPAAVIGFLSLAAVAGIFFRRQRGRRHSAFAGMLCGVAVAALIEGLCFTAN